jgi:hypothetical protein
MRYGPLKILALAISLSACGQLETPVVQYQSAAWSVDGVLVQGRTVELPGWFWAGLPFACGPALAHGPKGEIVVTSDVLPTLWRIDPKTHAVTVHAIELDTDRDKELGFSSISYSPRHGAYFAVSQHGHGSLWRIDPLLRRAQKTAISGLTPRGCEPNWGGLHVFPDQRTAFLLPQR